MDIDTFKVEDLAIRCAEENAKFFQKMAHDTRYCFELFRRALEDRIQQALENVREIYQPQLLRWVMSHPLFDMTGETAEYFSSIAFSQFYFALLESKFHRFPTLAHLMAYMKMCVHSAVAQYVRDYRPDSSVPLMEMDFPVSTNQFADVQAEQLWEHICRLLPDKNQRLLARCAFIFEMKPSDIAQLYPKHWSNNREVSVALYRIRQILRNDPEIQNWITKEIQH